MVSRWDIVDKGLERDGKGKNNLNDTQIRTLKLYYSLQGVSERFLKQLEHDLYSKRFRIFDWLGMTLGNYPGKTEKSTVASRKLGGIYLRTSSIPDFFREIEEEIEKLS